MGLTRLQADTSKGLNAQSPSIMEKRHTQVYVPLTLGVRTLCSKDELARPTIIRKAPPMPLCFRQLLAFLCLLHVIRTIYQPI